METKHSISSLREAIRAERALGKRIALVPTMGALHAGHISLVKEAARHADYVVVSIFVNPTQFGPNEDYSRYPRTLDADKTLLEGSGCNMVYAPAVEEMYHADAITRVILPGISEQLCGAHRPGHFDGVATVVTKLFMQTQPDMAFFGEKDYQQLCIIRRLTADLDIPVTVTGVSTMRETDGLAMSSRNRYLSDEQRKIAPVMYEALKDSSSAMLNGAAIDETLAIAKQKLQSAGFTKIDYIELCDAATLHPIGTLQSPARLLAAAYIGTTRLIDNIEVLP